MARKIAQQQFKVYAWKDNASRHDVVDTRAGADEKRDQYRAEGFTRVGIMQLQRRKWHVVWDSAAGY